MQAMEEELKMLRSGVAALLHRTTPVPRANAQLRRFCADLGRLLVASRPAESYDEGPGAPKSRQENSCPTVRFRLYSWTVRSLTSTSAEVAACFSDTSTLTPRTFCA